MRDPSILKKFRQDKPGGPVIFTGDTCVVKILEKFEGYGCLQVSDVVKTIGVFDMWVDNELTGMFLAARIEMHPSEIDTIEEDGVTYIKLVFYKGDTFMVTTNTVEEAGISFYVWMVFVKFGFVMKAMTYEDQATIFDRLKKTCGVSFPVDHAVYESIFAHLSRDANDLGVPFRNTKMNDDFRRINLNDVSHASRSTSARVIGSYFNDGINAALTQPSTSNSVIEDLLRQ